MSRNGKTYPPAPMIATFANFTLAFDANDHRIVSRVLPDSPTQLERRRRDRDHCAIFSNTKTSAQVPTPIDVVTTISVNADANVAASAVCCDIDDNLGS